MPDKTPNTYCEVCGARYYRCLACEKIGSWKIYCDTPEHFQVFMIVREYKQNHDLSLAREQCAQIGITPHTLCDFLPNVREILSEIFEENRIPMG